MSTCSSFARFPAHGSAVRNDRIVISSDEEVARKRLNVNETAASTVEAQLIETAH